MITARTCGDAGGVTVAGTPCRSHLNLSATNGRCLAHDDERIEERLAHRRAGGRGAGEARRAAKVAPHGDVPKAPKTLQDAVALSSWITRAVLTGQIDVRVAEAATKSVRQFQLSEEKHAMAREIAALRAQLDAAKKGR